MTKGIVHMQIIGGTKEQIALIGKALNKIKEATNQEFEFLITNENIQIRDVKYMLDDLYKLYKKDKELKSNPLVDKDIQKLENKK